MTPINWRSGLDRTMSSSTKANAKKHAIKSEAAHAALQAEAEQVTPLEPVDQELLINWKVSREAN